MAGTIDFDYQVESSAEEINDVLANRFLAIKITAHHLSPLQMLPQDNLSHCGIASKGSGFLL
jgi:hypothetical protein